MKALKLSLIVTSIVTTVVFAMQSPSAVVEPFVARAQTMAEASKNDLEQAKQKNDEIIAVLQELQQASTSPTQDAIKLSLTKQYNAITTITLQGKRLTRMISQSEEIALYKQQITKPENLALINPFYNSIQTNTIVLAGDIEKNLLVIQQMIALIIDILQQQVTHKTLITPLLDAEKNIGLLLSQKNVGHAQHAAYLAIQIGELITNQKDNQKDTLAQAQKLADEIKKLLPPPPTQELPESPIKKPTDPSAPSTLITPTKPSPPATIAPGKAGENIQKANNKLSSAIRRIETVKKYYPDIDREEKNVIKKKAVDILKEYESDILSFTQKIQQVKHEAGNQLSEAKLAPFNTFLELVNKLSSSINGL